VRAAHTARMRRPPAALCPVLLLVVLPCVVLAPALRPGRALLAVATPQLSPWRATTTPEALAVLERDGLPLAADKTLMFQPQLELAQRRLAAGEAPLWNPDVLCGAPLLAQAVHGVLSPPLLLAAAFGATRAFALVAALQVALAGWLMYRLAREYALDTLPATLAGLAFAWCGFLAVRLDWYQIQGASIWLPAALLAVERAFRGGRAGAVALLGIAVGLSLLAGFPQSSVLCIDAAGALAAARAVSAWRGGVPARSVAGAGATCAAGLALGLLLGAPQLLPAADVAASPDSSRAAETPEAIAGLALDPAALLAAVVPDLFGHPRDLARHALPHLRDEGVLRRLLCRPGGNWVETACSFGLPPLLLALLGLLSARRGARVAGVLFVVGGLLALKTPLLPWVLRLPALDAGDPRRFILLFEAGGALLAGFGLQRLLDDGPPGWYLRSLGLIATLLLLACATALALDGPGWVDAVAPGLAARTGLPEAEIRVHADELVLDLSLLRTALVRAALVGLLTVGAVALAARRRSLGAAVLLLAAGADLLTFAARSASVLPTAGHFAPPPVLQFLRDPDGGRLARFVATDQGAALTYPLPPNTGLPFGIHDLSGYVTLGPRRVEALHEKLQRGTATGLGVKALTDPAALDSPLLDAFAVTRVLSSIPLARPGLTPLGRAGDAWLYANDSALPRARLAESVRLCASEAEASALLDRDDSDPRTQTVVEAAGQPGFEAAAAATGPPGQVRLVVDEPERLVLDVVALRPAVLLVADSWMPGWEALVDDAPAALAPADLAFRAVALEAGGHRVELLYRPDGWRLGLIAGAAGLLGLGYCAWSARSAARRPPTPP